jgi:hypothetical protein
MGVDIADFNNDALPDIITLDMLPEDNRRQKLLQLQENYESFALMVNQGLNPQYMRNMLHLNNGIIKRNVSPSTGGGGDKDSVSPSTGEPVPTCREGWGHKKTPLSLSGVFN